MATTPPSEDPQVPGNYPGTVQNPTQSPAPVSPAVNPEVPALPNDVDPNYIPNPVPVNNTIDPEVPQPDDNLTTKKRIDPESVSPAANPQVPEPPIVQNLFYDEPAPIVQNLFYDEPAPIVQNLFYDATPVSPAANPQMPQPDSFPEEGIDLPAPVAPAANPQVPSPPIVQNYFTDAEPVIIQNYFTDEPTPIVQNYFTDPVLPTINLQVPQVPNVFSSISALLTNLFGIRPTPVAPAVNPQVARAIPVQTPVVLTPTPIPPAANPQVPEPPIVQNLFYDATPVSPAANPQVPEPPIVQNLFYDEPAPIVQNLFYDEPAPIVQNLFYDATPVSPAANPQVPEPPIVQNLFYDATPVSPAANPEVPGNYPGTVQNPTQSPAPVSPAANPEVPALPNDVDPNYIPNPAPVAPAVNPEVPQPAAPAPTFVPQKEFVDSAGGAAIGIRSIPTKIDGPVDQATFQQANPPAASAYDSYVVDTQNKIVEQQTKELEATQGFPVSENQIAVINGQAFGTATIAANVKFKDDIEAARAAPAVPVDTPPPTVAAPAVSPDSNAQVPSSANTRVENVNQSALAQKDPALYRQWQDTFAARTEQNIARTIAAEEAVQGRPINAEDKALIVKTETFKARTETNAIYQDELQKVNAVTTVPANTPPPTVAAASVSTESNAQVPNTPTKVVAVSTETLLQNDPETAREYTAFKNETATQLTEQRIAEREAVEGGPISVSEQVQIAARAEIDATADANFRYQDQIEAASAGTVVPADTPPPTVTAPAVSTESNPQVVVPATKIEAVSTETLLQNDPKTAQEYTDFRNEQTLALTSQRVVELEATTGTATTLAQQRQIAGQAFEDATTDANFRYQDQIQAAGAATVVPADTPPPTVIPPAQVFGTDPQVPQPDSFPEEGIDLPVAPAAGVDPQIPQPDSFPEEGIDQPAPVQSPSPYERFIAEEAAATDAAQAEATARFNAQFDVVTEDPQAFPVDSGAANPGRELAPVADTNTGYLDFNAADAAATAAADNIGEFQAEPAPVADTNTGYLDFNAADAAATAAADNIGEFQAEPAPVAITDGYLDFNAADAAATAAADDIGEFQAEPGTGDGESSGFSDFSDGIAAAGGNFFGSVKKSAGAVSGGSDPVAGIFDSIFGGDSPRANPKTTVSPQQAAANREKSAKAQAKQQNIINQQRKQANDGDWRVKLRLAGSADYLYNAPNPGILAPLSQASGTGGVIFPYTPTITTAYQAKYNAYELTHSNYKGYFYQGSSVGDITINAAFTAQDTVEANYLLAVIHFFRSVTKMFYGQDDAARRGAPPPLVFLQGLGEYQFNLHPCVVSNFNYTMPNDVDYIRALSPNNSGTNLTNRRSLQSGVSPFVNPSTSRLQNAGLPQGGITTPTAPPTLGTNSPTYVPTKMEIQITLLAIQTRSQVSNQFSLKNFANGDLIKGGFW